MELRSAGVHTECVAGIPAVVERYPLAVSELLEAAGGFARWQERLDLPAPMPYAILSRKSAVQSSHRDEIALACNHGRLLRTEGGGRAPQSSPAAWAVSAALLWLLGEEDAAHEAVLATFNVSGTDVDVDAFVDDLKVDGWRERHHMCQEQVLLHSALHRSEGPWEADGLSLTGYQNAKIWCDRLDPHFLVLEQLVPFSRECAPAVAARCVVGESGTTRLIPVRSPGKSGSEAWEGPGRIVSLEPGTWDPFAFIDLCQEVREDRADSPIHQQVLRVQHKELVLCFDLALANAMCVAPCL